MNDQSTSRRWAVVLIAACLMVHAGIAEAQRRGGGGARGGGFSRQGPAASGGFSSQRSRPSAAPSQRAATPATRAQPAQGASTGQRPDARTGKQQAGTASGPEQQGTRPEERTERQENRQEGRTERQDNRQEAYEDIDVYYPPYGGYHYDDDWDHWDDVAVGVVVGGVVGAAVASSEDEDEEDEAAPPAAGSAALPCNPAVTQSGGVTYYRCGDTYYVQAYGGSGPIFMPVPPPG